MRRVSSIFREEILKGFSINLKGGMNVNSINYLRYVQIIPNSDKITLN